MKHLLLLLCLIMCTAACPAYGWDILFGLVEPVHGSQYFVGQPYYSIYFTGTRLIVFNDQDYFDIEIDCKVIDAVELDDGIMILTESGEEEAGIYWLNEEDGYIRVEFELGHFNFLEKDYENHIIYAGADDSIWQTLPGGVWFNPTYNGMSCNIAAFQSGCGIFGCMDEEYPRVFYTTPDAPYFPESENHILLKDIAFTPDGTVFAIGEEGSLAGIFKSTGCGANWELAYEYAYFNSIATDIFGNVFAGCSEPGSQLYGLSAMHRETLEMVPLNQGLACLDVNNLSRCPTLEFAHILAETELGVYILFEYENELSLQHQNTIEKMDFSLSNHPNPFNPSTTISFVLADEEDITLSIFNIKGQLVKELISHKSFPSGNHSVVWNGTDNLNNSVSSAIYLCRLDTGDETKAIKLILCK